MKTKISDPKADAAGVAASIDAKMAEISASPAQNPFPASDILSELNATLKAEFAKPRTS